MSDASWCAASRGSSIDSDVLNLILCHSIRWEANFMPPFVATKRAVDLQYEVANTLLLEGSKFWFPTDSDVIFPPWPVVGSILKKTTSSCRHKGKVSFDDDPLSFNRAVLISEGYEHVNTNEGLHNHQTPPEGLDLRALGIVPNFVQDIFAQLAAAGIDQNLVQEEGFVVRTWYLHHQNFPRWRVPRFVELDHIWARWRTELERSWRDMIDPGLPVEIYVVQPDPYRHYLQRRVDLDVILAQSETNDLFAGLLTLEQQQLDRPRTNALAISLPLRVSGTSIAQAADLQAVCRLSDCSVYFRWTHLPMDDEAVHDMQNGHGFQAHVRPRIRVNELYAAGSTDSVSLMQHMRIRKQKPMTCNEPDAHHWYPGIQNQGQAVLANFHLLENEHDNHEEGDAGEEESGRSDDPILHPPDDDDARQAVMMFHLAEAPIHAMLDWTDWPRMIREIAYHYAVDREDVIDCYEMNARPPDIPEGIAPIIVQQAADVPVGTAYVLILVDIEVHGQWMEAHYGIAPIVERRVVAVPSLLSRNALLSQARVFEFCRFEKHRCLVDYNLFRWPHQDPDPRHAMYGDYARIILPPSLRCEVSTGELLADSRQMTVEEFWAQYYEPSTPSSTNSEAADSNVSPSLLNSEAIREEFGPHHAEDADDMSVMQRQLAEPTSQSSGDVAQTDQVEVAPGNNTCVDDYPDCIGNNWPLWLRFLFATFRDHHEIEDINEGPVAYVNTWYLDCSVESANEDSRVVRLPPQPTAWVQTIRRRWQDKIDASASIHLTWVYPTPTPNPFERTIGHLILFQHPHDFHVPILLNFQFTALRDGTGNAAVVIQKDASPEHIVEIVKLERVCRGRRCTLHRRIPDGRWGQDLKRGECLKLIIPSPGERAHSDLYTNPYGSVIVHPADFIEPEPLLSMRIEDFPLFFQELHHLWVQFASRMPAALEKVMEITTWYVDGRSRPFNDHSREVVLADDFNQWENEIRNAWADLIDVDEPLDLFFVKPVPPPSPLDHIHVLVTQHVPVESIGVILTRYDNALQQGRPSSAAAVVHQWVTREELIRSAGVEVDCILRANNAHCSTWHEGREIQNQPLQAHNGYGFNVIVHRSSLVSWDGDEAEEHDEQNLLQQRPGGKASVSSFNAHAQTFIPMNDKQPSMEQSPQHEHNSIRLEMDGVISAQQWLDQHFTLPTFDIEVRLEGKAHWHPHTLTWIRQEWFASDCAVDSICIYYDGSFIKSSGAIGFAAAAFVQVQGRWFFAGAISGSDSNADEMASYQSELQAALLALKFLYDLVKIQYEVFGNTPQCDLVFDSQTVGNQTAGHWKSTRAVHACHLARSILRVCETRFSIDCNHWFSPGHKGEPGNELVDTLAWCAAHGEPLQDWSHFLRHVQHSTFVKQMEWSWMLHTHWEGTFFDDANWVCPSRPTTQPDVRALPTSDVIATSHTTLRKAYDLRIASCNILQHPHHESHHQDG